MEGEESQRGPLVPSWSRTASSWLPQDPQGGAIPKMRLSHQTPSGGLCPTRRPSYAHGIRGEHDAAGMTPTTMRQRCSGCSQGMRMTRFVPSDADAALFCNRFSTTEVPSTTFPDAGMGAIDAMRLVGEDLALEGDPARNLATFVTTWMEPEAQRIIAENLHRNFIDHADIRGRPRSSSAASGCSPTCSTRRGRPPAPGPRGPRRRSCSGRCP